MWRWWMTPLVLCLIGAAAFVFVTGGRIAVPTHVDWIKDGDPAQAWLGWQFFRTTPLLQWPLGLNPAYGAEIATSIIFTDLLPLFAFLFKPLQPILPDRFQYFGLWLLVCFILQPFFAWKLLSNFTRDNALLIAGSLFFLLAPIALVRLHGHYALCGQWLLLWGLHLYFRGTFLGSSWVLLVSLAALIQGYFVPMVFGIFLADLAQRLLLRQVRPLWAASYLVAAVACLALVAWSAGYFVVEGGVKTGGFGHFRMNLLAPLDPGWLGSLFLRAQDVGPGDYEGFAYLGLGMLALALFAVAGLFSGVRPRLDSRTLPILIACLGMAAYALSNKISIGKVELISYELPPLADLVTGAFRSSGRFIWPAVYALYAVILLSVFRQMARKRALAVVAVLFAAQVLDMTPALQRFRESFVNAAAWQSPLRAPIWESFGREYRRVVVVLPANHFKSWLPLGRFAMQHRMSINAVYMSRVDAAKLDLARRRTAEDVADGKFAADSLYIFEGTGLWRAALLRLSSQDLAGHVDGFRVLAPGMKACRGCKFEGIVSVADSELPAFGFGQRIDFSSKGPIAGDLNIGWHTPENWGVWGRENATVVLKLTESPDGDVSMRVNAHALLTKDQPKLPVTIVANGRAVETLEYRLGDPRGERAVTIPGAVFAGANGVLRLEFRTGGLRSPAELGLSRDPRRLGLGVVSLTFTRAPR